MGDAIKPARFEGLLGLSVPDPKPKCALAVSSSIYNRIVKITARRVRVATFSEVPTHQLARRCDVLAVFGKRTLGGHLLTATLKTLFSSAVGITATNERSLIVESLGLMVRSFR